MRIKNLHSQRLHRKQISISRCKRKQTRKFRKSFNSNNSDCYKSLHHRINCCTFNLCTDIEKNPGPTFIDPSKTVHAPYIMQGSNVLL